MKLRNVATFGSLTLGAFGLGLAVKSFLPQHLATESPTIRRAQLIGVTTAVAAPPIDGAGASFATEALELEKTQQPSTFPEIDINFLRCGSTTIPTCIAVRGASLFTSCVIAYSAVLVRHPKASFLYDTGLCSDIYLYLADQPLLFRKTLANFVFEQSLTGHLQHHGLRPTDIDFALISHLHWDHVSGIPDIPGVLLRINRVEYDAARLGLLDANHALVRQLLCDNPLEFFDCADKSYAGFRSSHDLFGDGSIILVPLPGHTAGNTGMFIHRSNGSPLFLLGDAAWVAQNYLRPATMHPIVWRLVTSDDATARQTLIDLHHFSLSHPHIPSIAMHDAEMQEKIMALEHPHVSTPQ